jgi:hypothetical protein
VVRRFVLAVVAFLFQFKFLSVYFNIFAKVPNTKKPPPKGSGFLANSGSTNVAFITLGT